MLTHAVVDPSAAEASLRDSEESYRTIFELASDAIFVHDIATGAILDANRKACQLHDCTLDELKALGVAGISEGAPPFDEAHAREYVSRAAAGEPQCFEWFVRRKGGELFWVEVHLQRVRLLGEDRVLASVRDIDARKRAEEALRAAHAELEKRVLERTAELAERTTELARAEQRFRAIAGASPTPFLLSRLEDGLILYANDRLEDFLGVAPGSLTGRKTPDFYFDPDDRHRVVERLQLHGAVRDHELRIKLANGTPRWVSLSAQRLEFDGAPALATSLIDITERRETADALRASEASYRGLFDSLTELVYVQDLEGRFLNVNQAVLDAYGYSLEEIVGHRPDFLSAPGLVDLTATMDQFLAAVEGEPQRFDWWGRRKDGSIFPKEVVLKRSTYFGQDVVIAVGRDISERVEAEDARRRSEEYFRRLIENASDLISIMDGQGIIRYQSPAIKRLLGYEPDELTGHNAFDYLLPEDVAPTRARWQLVMEEPGTPVSADFSFRHKDGSWRAMEGRGTTLSPESVADGVIVNSRDITERRRAEAALRLQKTLLEAQHEASIDGILVVSDEGKIISHNYRFAEMWSIPPDIVDSGDDAAAIQCVLDQLRDPGEFIRRIEFLYAHPQEKARDEIALCDGRVFDRYSAPVISSEGDYYGRIWFFRDVTLQKRHAEDLEQARQEADRAQQKAHRYARTLERELEFGRRIQQGLFPAVLPQPPGWEVAVRFRPVWQVAGDFYDVFELPNGRLALIVADVSGKGVGAALFMALFQGLLRASAERTSRNAREARLSDEDVLIEAVTSTNEYIMRVHRHAHMFASVFFALIDHRTGLLTYVNAGNEPPVVVSPGQPPRQLAPTGPALGLLRGASFNVGQLTLPPGALVLAYTDGVTESRNRAREFFTDDRLLAQLNGSLYSPEALVAQIDEAVHSFADGAAPADDLTLLAVQRLP
jgi:PAS domain S-box-containing protein